MNRNTFPRTLITRSPQGNSSLVSGSPSARARNTVFARVILIAAFALTGQ
jgi:hypothetical protein